VTDASAGTDLADDRKDDVFCSDAWSEHAINGDAHPLGSRLRKCLRGEHMLHLAGADAECECTECPVCCRVAVAAHDRHARQGATLLWSNDVHDALTGISHWVQRDAKFFGVPAHHLELLGGNGVGNGQVNVGSRHIVVFGGNREVWSANCATVDTQAVERLGARHFMDEVEIYIEEIGLIGAVCHHMAIPHLLGQRERGSHATIQPRLGRNSVALHRIDPHISAMNELETPLTLATCVEHSLHLSLDGFDEHQARLYGVSVVSEEAAKSQEDGALRITFLAEHGDVYELLEAPTSSVVRMFDAAAVLTSGWAAPISDEGSDTPPSRHPERRRVRLVVVVCDDGVASVLRFADTPDDVITDAGAARGSLADAVTHLWFDPPVHAVRR